MIIFIHLFKTEIVMEKKMKMQVIISVYKNVS